MTNDDTTARASGAQVESADTFARYHFNSFHENARIKQLVFSVEMRDAQVRRAVIEESIAKIEEYRTALSHFPLSLHRADVDENMRDLIATIRAMNDPEPTL